MKRALAIVCSLLLLWTQFVLGQAPVASETIPVRACCACSATCCTPASSSPLPTPASTAPVSSSHQLLTLAPPALAWTLPGAVARPLFPFAFASPLTPGAPLYARNCALLI